VTAKSNNKKIVIILGAGSTIDNADVQNEYEKPPSNKNFFKKTYEFLKSAKIDTLKRHEMLYEFEYVRAYFEIWHGRDIFSDKCNFLEIVMAQIFTDVKTNSPPERPAFQVFLAFLRLFYDILGETTNNIKTDSDKPLYQILANFIRNGVSPENLTIISFNYDIYVERILATLARSFHDPNYQVFLLQNCYELNLSIFDFTMASRPIIGWFPVLLDAKKGGVRVLKLHGSLNWYSPSPTKNIEFDSMFKRDRVLKISREMGINSNQLRYRTREGHLCYTLPVIVPPIRNKSEIYHSKILKLWDISKKSLFEADEILIYGYSCPDLDIDVKELLRESVHRNRKIQNISVIDPTPAIHEHYAVLFNPKGIRSYFNSSSFFN